MTEAYDDPDGPFCDRCKSTTKASEWKFKPSSRSRDRRAYPDHFEHILVVDGGSTLRGWMASVPVKR